MRQGFLVAGLIFFAALFMHDLPARPLHNDEAVNAWFLGNLIKSNNFKYDPKNYHGPSLFYIQLGISWVNHFIQNPRQFSFRSDAGVTATSLRTGVVGAGLLTLLLVLLCRNRIGPLGSVLAMLLLGLSCDFLFFSRYFIHEIYFVLFTLGLYISMTRYWDNGEKKYLNGAAALAALLFSTKETSVVIFFILGFSWMCAEAAVRTPVAEMKKTLNRFFENVNRDILPAFAIAVSIWVLLYTSFFTNWAGPYDSIRTYMFWTKEGLHSGHEKPFLYFLKDFLILSESPLLFGWGVGLLVALITKNKQGLYLTAWSCGVILAHSLIPYKTPWLVLNMLLPMALLSGFGLQHLWDNRRSFFWGAAFILVVLSALQAPKTFNIVYREYDNETHKQVYVHTARDVYRLVDEIDRIAKTSGLKENITINIVSAIEWPLPFYLRHYPKAYFWRQYENIPKLDAPLIIAQPQQKEALLKLLERRYTIKNYTLRPGVPLDLYIREDMK